MAIIYGAINQKGGVGKTSLVQNVGSEFALAGHPTLLIDFDPQANLTQGFGIQPEKLEYTVYHAMLNPAESASMVINLREGLDLLPADLTLAGAEQEFSQAPFGRTTKLRKALEPLEANYAYILIDCPPSLGFFTVNALAAADGVIVPMQCEYYAYLMIKRTLSFVEMAQQENSSLQVSAIVPTMYDARTGLSEGVVDAARETYPQWVTQTIIPRNVSIATAPMEGKTVREYDSRSTGAATYQALAKELLENG